MLPLWFCFVLGFFVVVVAFKLCLKSDFSYELDVEQCLEYYSGNACLKYIEHWSSSPAQCSVCYVYG